MILFMKNHDPHLLSCIIMVSHGFSAHWILIFNKPPLKKKKTLNPLPNGAPPQPLAPSVWRFARPCWCRPSWPWTLSHLTLKHRWSNRSETWWNTHEILMKYWWFFSYETWLQNWGFICGRPGSRIVQWHGDSSLSLWQLRWPKGRMCRSWPPHSTNSNGVVPQIEIWKGNALLSNASTLQKFGPGVLIPPSSPTSETVGEKTPRSTVDYPNISCEISHCRARCALGCNHCSARCLSISWSVMNVEA